jgi:hypothetical protein
MSIIITCPDLYKAMALILHKIHKHEDKQINVYLQQQQKMWTGDCEKIFLSFSIFERKNGEGDK